MSMTFDQTSMPQQCHFLRLPTELRLNIYQHLYKPPEGQPPIEVSFPIWGPVPIWLHKLELRRENLHAACNTTKRAFWSVLQVCKLVNQELSDLLFERLLYVVYIINDPLDDNSAPNLGRAKDFQFWQRARRVLLVPPSKEVGYVRDLIGDFGQGLRCFKSTPQDTVAFLYFRDELHINRIDRKARNGALKSFSSLSQRAKLHFEVKNTDLTNGREEAQELVDATNGSAILLAVDYHHSGIPRAGSEEITLAKETFRQDDEGDPELIPGHPSRKRIVCLMSSRARFLTARAIARKAREERILRKKQLYEGRLG